MSSDGNNFGLGYERSGLGDNQEELLSELLHSGEWCPIGSSVCGSTYGGRSRHERIVRSLQKRGLVETREVPAGGTARMEARAVRQAAEEILRK